MGMLLEFGPELVTFADVVKKSEKVVPLLERCIVKPCSLFELSLQVRAIWLLLTTFAERLLGAVNGVAPFAVFDSAEFPAELYAITR